VPEHIRGFGHVRQARVQVAKKREGVLLAAFRSPTPAAEPVVVKMPA